MSRELPTVTLKKEELSPSEYVDLVRENTGKIARAVIRPPRVGVSGNRFGTIIVEYKTPITRVVGKPSKLRRASKSARVGRWQGIVEAKKSVARRREDLEDKIAALDYDRAGRKADSEVLELDLEAPAID